MMERTMKPMTNPIIGPIVGPTIEPTIGPIMRPMTDVLYHSITRAISYPMHEGQRASDGRGKPPRGTVKGTGRGKSVVLRSPRNDGGAIAVAPISKRLSA